MLRRISRVGIDEADSDDTNSSIESEQCSNQEEEEQIQDVEEEMVQEEKVDVVKLDTKLVLTSDEFPTIVGTPYESGPVMDINHLGVVEMEYHRRSKAVELIRTYLKYKSLPGHEIRTKRERNMKSIFSKFARGYLRICPCVRPKMSDAVWDGDIILVHSLVGFESFDARSPEGETLLSIAIQQKRDQIAKFLLKRGADFDLEDYNTKKTPLVHAVIMGNKSLARKLVQLGANQSATDSDQFTPFLWAALRGYLEILVFFHQVDETVIHHREKYGMSALHLAAFRGFTEVVEYLLDVVHLSPHDTDVHGFTAITYAQMERHFHLLPILTNTTL